MKFLIEGQHAMDRGMDVLLRLFEVEPETRKWFDFEIGDASDQIRTSRKLLLLAHRAVGSVKNLFSLNLMGSMMNLE